MISLDHNRIERIPEDTFVDLIKLKFLSISYNKLKSLTNNVFHTLSSLEGIYLNNNDLKEISQLLFKYNYKLKEIYLHNNQLEFVSRNFTENLENLHEISLSANICIDGNYTSTTYLIEKVSTSCNSECESEIAKATECDEKVYALVKENEELKREISKLRNYLRSNLMV